MLHIDFETRSTCDLKAAGLFRYASDPSTDILCMAYRGDAWCGMWTPGEALPQKIVDHVTAGHRVAAHKADFEFVIWNKIGVAKYGFPPLTQDQMVCSLAACAAVGLPLGLEGAARALSLSDRKDAEGRRIMLQLSRPRKYENGEPVWWQDADKSAKLFAYCRQDVVVERALTAKVPALTPYERKIWLLDQKINARGVAIDMPFVRAASALAAKERVRLNQTMSALTGGQVKTCSLVGDLKKWLATQGVERVSLAKAELTELLESDLPPLARQAVQLRADFAKSSVAKYDSLLAYAGADGRVRGTLQYHGATTGRWAGRGPQLQNPPRGTLTPEEVEAVIADVIAGGSVSMNTLASCLRGAIIGDVLTSVDYSAVESRVLAWLAGQEDKLALHREGKVYKRLASKIFNIPIEEVTNLQKLAGKVSDLACGFQGAVGALQRMAKVYSLALADPEASTIVAAWREAHPLIVRFWYALQAAAMNAIRTPGVPFSARAIVFKVQGGVLWARLPSGRQLSYPQPKIEDGKFGDGITFGAALGKTWTRFHTYGGSLAENVTQAVARDLLADAMLRADAQGLSIVLHLHDEIVVEGSECVDKLSEIMLDSADWASGLPLAVEGWSARRFRK